MAGAKRSFNQAPPCAGESGGGAAAAGGGAWRAGGRRGRPGSRCGGVARDDDERLARLHQAEDAACVVLDVLVRLEIVAHGDELLVVTVQLRDVAADRCLFLRELMVVVD